MEKKNFKTLVTLHACLHIYVIFLISIWVGIGLCFYGIYVKGFPFDSSLLFSLAGSSVTAILLTVFLLSKADNEIENYKLKELVEANDLIQVKMPKKKKK